MEEEQKTIQRFMIYIDPLLLQRFKTLAKEHKRSANKEVVLVLEEYVQREEAKTNGTTNV